MIRVEYATILSVICICLLGTYCSSLMDELYAENEQLRKSVRHDYDLMIFSLVCLFSACSRLTGVGFRSKIFVTESR